MSDVAYCAVYVDFDAESRRQLVVVKPFFKSPTGPIAVLQTLRLQNSTGLCIGGTASALRRICRDLEGKDKEGQLVDGRTPEEVLNFVGELAQEYGLSIEHYQLGPKSGSSLPVLKNELADAISAMVAYHMSHSTVGRQRLESSLTLDDDAVLLTVSSPHTGPLEVKSWAFGVATSNNGKLTTSMVAHKDTIRSWAPGSEELAWSLWVRTGRQWNFSRLIGQK